MGGLRFFLASLLVLSTVVGNARAVVYYTVTDLGTLGGYSSGSLGINNSGKVVGYALNASNNRRAFLYNNGTMSDLGTLAGASTVARSINANGQVTGSSLVDNAYRAYRYSSGAMTSLGTLPGDFDSYGRAINSSGQVAGISRDFSYNAHAFLYDGTTMINLGNLPDQSQSRAYDLNNHGQVVGSSYNFRDFSHAFLYDNTTHSMTDLGNLGGVASVARAINDNGKVVGYSYNAANQQRAFIYDSSMHDLGTLGGWNSIARDINENNQVVGTSETAIAGVYHSFLYDNGTMTDLKSLIDPASRWNLTNATAINDSGSIVGVGRNPDGVERGFLMTPITRTDALLSLSANYADLRTMQGSASVNGASSVTINAAGNTTTGYTLTPTALTVNATSGTVAPAAVTPAPFTMRWNDTSTVGVRTGSVELANTDDPSGTVNHTMNVSGAVLANRVLNVTAIGTPSVLTRTIARAEVTATIGTGANLSVDGDNAATRVDTVASAKKKIGNATVTYATVQPGGVLLPTFNGINQSANVAMSFSRTGHYTGSIDLANNGFLHNGEDASVGAAVQPAVLSYNVAVLEPRKLKTANSRLDLGDVLRGAPISAYFTVTSSNANPSSDYTTMVNVAPGNTALGELTAGQTLVAGSAPVNVSLTGALDTYGKVNFKGSLPVASAEAVAVHDNTNYRSLNVRYTANVGIAKLSTSASFGSNETVLSARMANGSSLTNLASKVDPRGTLAANTTPASWVTGRSSLRTSVLYGKVGSEAEIVRSTTLSSDAIVTMQWRERLPSEARNPRWPASSTLPSGAWLSSDVVKISGVDTDVIYALQMSFDDRINRALHDSAGGMTKDASSLFLAEFDDSANQWVNAVTLGDVGLDAHTGVAMSLSGFLAAHPSTPLAGLQGSWGVDPVTSSTGLGHAWAIVAGSGTFAVDPSLTTESVPEPSAWALLIAAAATLAAYGFRRRKTA
jgi:probable HAF family extracellular repeat protein